MPIPTYGQVTIDNDTWDRLNARIAELEAALKMMRDHSPANCTRSWFIEQAARALETK